LGHLAGELAMKIDGNMEMFPEKWWRCFPEEWGKHMAIEH